MLRDTKRLSFCDASFASGTYWRRGVCVTVVAGVEIALYFSANENSPPKLAIHLLGEISILKDGVPQDLPQSRKARGLLAYLALSKRAERRDELCALLWEIPNDPRAALRWSLSKLRPLLTVDGESALLADRSTVGIDRHKVSIDAVQADEALSRPLEEIETAELAELESSFSGSYIAGLEGIGSAEFELWVDSQREWLNGLHRTVLDELVGRYASEPDRALDVARRRAALDPLDTAFNTRLLGLVKDLQGRRRAQDMLERMRAQYRRDGISDGELLSAWSRMGAARQIEQTASSETPADPAETMPLPDKPSAATNRAAFWRTDSPSI